MRLGNKRPKGSFTFHVGGVLTDKPHPEAHRFPLLKYFRKLQGEIQHTLAVLTGYLSQKVSTAHISIPLGLLECSWPCTS